MPSHSPNFSGGPTLGLHCQGEFNQGATQGATCLVVAKSFKAMTLHPATRQSSIVPKVNGVTPNVVPGQPSMIYVEGFSGATLMCHILGNDP
jgi:hypothetical protein